MQNLLSFLQTNTRDGGFLQSEEWGTFQESFGRTTVELEDAKFRALGISHTLPLVGEYLYFPRGPIFGENMSAEEKKQNMGKIIALAEAKKVKWIRIEPQTDQELAEWQEAVSRKIVKAPHDMQPKEIFMIDISLSEEEILSRMKQKTRYNIRLAEKKEVKVFITREEKYTQAFLDLIVATADRKVITPHPKSYYEKFLKTLPENMLHLFVAEYNGQVIAANLLCLFGNTALYLHGGSADVYRDVMAPYLLQWKQIQFAKERGATRYDFGGVKVTEQNGSAAWEGITRFKQGFQPSQEPLLFPGSYDIVLDGKVYFLYDSLRKVKSNMVMMKKYISRS